jgi:hypothetical protein
LGGCAKPPVVEFCDDVREQFAANAPERYPELRTEPPVGEAIGEFDYIVYRGKSVPLPRNKGAWYFGIYRNFFSLGNADNSFTYMLSSSNEEYTFYWAAEALQNRGLPAYDLDHLNMIKTALLLDPGLLKCDPDSVQETVNNFSALSIKQVVLLNYDVIYFLDDALLGYSLHGDRHTWVHLFQDQASGTLFEIRIDYDNPASFGGIELAIATAHEPTEFSGPSWIPAFFDAANEPVLENLELLKKAVSGFDLPEQSLEMLTTRINEAAP